MDFSETLIKDLPKDLKKMALINARKGQTEDSLLEQAFLWSESVNPKFKDSYTTHLFWSMVNYKMYDKAREFLKKSKV